MINEHLCREADWTNAIFTAGGAATQRITKQLNEQNLVACQICIVESIY